MSVKINCDVEENIVFGKALMWPWWKDQSKKKQDWSKKKQTKEKRRTGRGGEETRGEERRGEEERSDHGGGDHDLDHHLEKTHTLRKGVLYRLLRWLTVPPLVAFPDTYGGKLAALR